MCQSRIRGASSVSQVVVAANRARHERKDLRKRVRRLDVDVQLRVTGLRLAAGRAASRRRG